MLCCNMNIPCLIVELDAKAIVDVFKNPDYENHVISPILDDCRQLAAIFQQIQFNHCYRQANRCADMLARMGAEQELHFLMFNSPPVEVLSAFEDDCIGVYFNMSCPKLDVVFYFFDASFFNQIYIYIYIYSSI